MKPVLNFSTAQEIMNGCLEYAKSNSMNMCIAIYDTNAQLVCFAKMDGATIGSAKVAQWKGISASTYQFTTEETSKWNVPNAPDIATVPGGILIKDKDGNVIGSIGVSGSASTDDVKCAEAGLLTIK
ncbi:GlcG/HbpS family heme-binding protein [Flavobacterium sp. 25HG05S-40]|uniref:GlcG/HbpS family heme-binding protein n=1 Tax=Flavobacterium sp. 25HG05S-40 TaxID=3458682 RepID=UPI004043AF6E